MGLEQMGETRPSAEKTKTPPEVLGMENNLVGQAKDAFGENHNLVVEAMTGMGPRKAKEILEDLSKCRVATKDAIKKFRMEKERIYS